MKFERCTEHPGRTASIDCAECRGSLQKLNEAFADLLGEEEPEADE